MHVYHYAAYEITALKRLMGRYGTREDELDDLLRRGVFVDLLKVVRNGLRTSRPGYGLKEMEAFLDFERQAEVKDGGTSIVIFEDWMQTRDQALLDADRRVQREDCIATLLLRDWLLERRAEALARVRAVPARRSRSSRSRRRRRRPSGPRCARRCSTRARSSPRSCSTTTTASASRSGGRSSTGWS